jgi:hypothetical protein
MITEAEVAVARELLPVGCFLKHYADYGTRQVASHTFYHIGIGFSLVGAAMPRNLVALGFKAPTYPNLFAIICGPSGAAEKSLALDVALQLVSETAPELVGPDPTSDQALAKILEARPSQFFAYSEGGKFLAMTAGMQNQVGAGIRKGFTDSFDGRSYDREYSKGQKVCVAHPRPNLVLCCTPQDLEDCTVDLDWKGGMMSRFVFCYGVAERKVLEPEAWPAMRQWLAAFLLESKAQPLAGECLPMEESVRARWLAWQDDILERYAPYMNRERTIGIVSRTRLMAAKMATSLSWQCRRGWSGVPWRIEADVLEAAIAFAEIHLRSGLALAARIPANWDMRDQNRLLAGIGAKWTALGVAVGAADLTLKKAKLHIETLTERGLIAYEQQGTTVYYRRIQDGAPPEYDFALAGAPPPPPPPPPPPAPAIPAPVLQLVRAEETY